MHRLQTQSPETEPFASTMLLKASEQRVHLKKKLRYLLLLTLRILLLILLALAFAKPVIERAATLPAAAVTTLHIIVIDTSFSVAHGDRFSRATDTAREIIDAMKLIWKRMKIVLAPSSAVPLATILKNRELFSGRRVGVIITGGNVDLDAIHWQARQG